MFVDGELTAADTGELQLTAYGISGIPVFQISRYASKALYEQKEVVAMLDFLPEYSVDKVKILLKERAKRQPEKTAEQFFTGLFHEKLAAVWLKFAKIKKEKLCGDFTDADIQLSLIHISEPTRLRRHRSAVAALIRHRLIQKQWNPDLFPGFILPENWSM